MNNKELWNKFLDNIKLEITNVSFETWFNEDDTKFYSFNDGIVTITVNQNYIKKHLEEHYLDQMMEVMRKITNFDVTFNIVLEDEIKALEAEKKKQIKVPFYFYPILQMQTFHEAY